MSWPWPEDTHPLMKVQRIARSYRDIAQQHDPDAVAAQDRVWFGFGHRWMAPMGRIPNEDEWVSVADAAHYASQWHPCTPRNIRDWIARQHVESKIDEDGNLSVLWSSVLKYDAHRQKSA